LLSATIAGYVVVGIGLNVLQRTDDFAPELRDRAASLGMMLHGTPAIDRHLVAATVIERLEWHYSRWQDEFSAIMEACKQMGCLPPGLPAKQRAIPSQGPPF